MVALSGRPPKRSRKLEKVAAVVALAAAALVADVEIRRLHRLRVQVAAQERLIEQQAGRIQRFAPVQQEQAAVLAKLQQQQQEMAARAQAVSNLEMPW